MVLDGAPVLHGPYGPSGPHVYADAHCSLVEVRLAVRGGGREAHHAHDRVALEQYDAGVRDALVGVVLEDVVEVYELLNQDNVRLSAEGEEPCEDIGDVALDVRDIKRVSVRLVV